MKHLILGAVAAAVICLTVSAALSTAATETSDQANFDPENDILYILWRRSLD